MQQGSGRSSIAKHLVFGISILAVPLVLLAIRLTEGAIMPHLPGRQDTWNVQYMLPVSVAILVIVILRVFRRRTSMGDIWYWLAVIWNLALAAFFLWGLVYLWGEKY